MKYSTSKHLARAKRILLFLLATILCLPSSAVFASTEDFIDKFAANNIMFYNPDECEEGSSGGAVVGGEAVISGTTAAEKVWSGLKSMNISDEIVAGIMGNMQHESNSFNPAQHEGSFYSQWGSFDLGGNEGTSYGLGLIQWSFGRRVKMYNYVKDHAPGLIKYFDNPKEYSYANGSPYGMNGDGFIKKANNEEEVNALYSLELTFLVNEELKVTDAYSGIFNQTSVYDAAKFFLEHVEVPKNPYISAHPERATDAEKYFQQFSGKTSFSGGGSNSIAVDGNKITIIGDSITEASKSALSSKLPGVDIHSQVSKHFAMEASGNPSGLSILKDLDSQKKIREVLVFALGTNDEDGVSSQSIQTVIDTAKAAGTKKVVFLTNFSTSSDYKKNNDAFNKAATDNPDLVSVGDWAGAVKDNVSKYIVSDGVHPTSDGSELFADIIMKAIGASARSASSGNNCICEEKPSAGTFSGKKYDLTDEQLRGILAMIKAENGGTMNAVKFEASIMANVFEKYGPGLGEPATADGLVHYLKRSPHTESGWFNSFNDYNVNFTDYTQEEFDAVKDILKNGNRTLPPQILEHDSFGDIKSIEVNGQKYTDHDNIYKLENYVSGKTRIVAIGDPYIFYSFANPDGTKASDSSENGGTGDPFGYFENNPPSQTSGGVTNTAKSSVTWTNGWITAGMDGYIKDDANSWGVRIDSSAGTEYATTSLKGSGSGPNKILLHNTEGTNQANGDSAAYMYSGHDVATPPHFTIDMKNKKVYQHFTIDRAAAAIASHDRSAGIQIEIAGFGGTSQYKSSDWYLPNDANFGDAEWDYLAKLLVAISSETKIPLESTLGWGHNEPRLSASEFESYTGILGHKHAPDNDHTDPEDVWDKIKAAIERAGGGSGECHTAGTNGLKVGGMTLAEAEEFMKGYKELLMANKGKTSFSVTTVRGETATFSGINCDAGDGPNAMKNCVSFSWWFLRKYVDKEPPSPIGNGQEVVGNLKNAGFPTGDKPRPYAIFSWSGGTYGHTGVVLGVIDEKHFIVGESSCSSLHTSSWAAQAKEYSLDDGHNWSFAYTDEWIKL